MADFGGGFGGGLNPNILLRGAQGVQAPDLGEALSLAAMSDQTKMRRMALEQQQKEQASIEAANRVLPGLVQAKFAPEAVNAALQQEPLAAQHVLKIVDAKRKADDDSAKSRAGALKDNTEARSKALNDIGNAADAFYKNPQNPNGMPMLASMAKFYGIDLPPPPTDPRNPQALQDYYGMLRDSAYATKDRESLAEQKRAHGVTEAGQAEGRAQTASHQKAMEGAAYGNLSLSREKFNYEKAQQGAQGAGGEKAPAGYRWKPDGSLVAIAGGPHDPQAANKPLTEVQGNASAFGSRMAQADKVLDELQAGGANLTALSNKLADNGVTNAAASDNAQTYTQAKRNFMLAALRKESGAAISKTEYDTFDKTYFPQFGDGQKVIAEKKALRVQAIENMRTQAGPTGAAAINSAGGGESAPAGAPKLGERRKGYVYKGGDPSQQSSWEKV